MTARFKRLNAQIGAYETYDDAMFGVKAFHGVSLLIENEPATRELRKALGSLQVIEDALPYEPRKRVRDDIPVGVYHVIADFGQARGTNTATILPNDPLLARRYGRTILLRENIMKNPALFASGQRVWRAPRRPRTPTISPRRVRSSERCGTRSGTTSDRMAKRSRTTPTRRKR